MIVCGECGTPRFERNGILICPECDGCDEPEGRKLARARILNECVTNMRALWLTCDDEAEYIAIRQAALAIEKQTRVEGK